MEAMAVTSTTVGDRVIESVYVMKANRVFRLELTNGHQNGCWQQLPDIPDHDIREFGSRSIS